MPFMGGNAQGIMAWNVLETVYDGWAKGWVEPMQKFVIQIEMPGCRFER